ncbi:MAG TPA: class I SAM-dependent methyltransferase [Verrucomicrobiae bacterium]|nr:class I SAM-dependent methyltransferase [Verrucomicrobiae bacterium]
MTENFQPRFGHVAEEFQRYRPDYPPELYQRILAKVPEQNRARAMDLGAGTGMVTGHLIPHFREVISVEPDAQMAAKIAERFPQAVIRIVPAEECRQAPGSVDLVTIANALHWMDAERVFGNAHEWLREDATLAVFDRPLPKTGPEVDAVTRAEFRGPWKPFRDPLLSRNLTYRAQLEAAPGFRIVEETKIPNTVPMRAEEFAGFWRSTSYGSAFARGLPDPESYWASLESRFRAAAGDDKIHVEFIHSLILAQRIQ